MKDDPAFEDRTDCLRCGKKGVWTESGFCSGCRPSALDTSKPIPRCGTCRFFKEERSLVTKQGRCRRYPPRLPDEELELEGNFLSQFPTVLMQDYWCGEYQPIPRPPQA